MFWKAIRPRLWMAAACVIFAVGAVIHLEVATSSPERIWGDEGDGFFNLWLLDHTCELLRQSRLREIPDGRIFAPEPSDTFFWSDNLLVPALPYSFFRFAGAPRFESFLWTGYLLAAFYFLGFCFLFHQLDRLGRRCYALWPSWSAWCIPAMAYAAFFTPGILGNGFQHFQNLSALWLFVMIGAMTAFLTTPAGWALWLIAFCQTALLCSSLYFAVIGFVLILFWAGFELMRDAPALMRRVLRTIPALLPLALCAGWIAIHYLRIPHDERPGRVVKELAIEAEHVYTPSAGAFRDLLIRKGVALPRVHHEKPAYPGIGILAGIILLIPFALVAAGAALFRDWRSVWVALPLLLYMFCMAVLRGHSVELLRVSGGALALACVFPMALQFCARQSRVSPMRAMVMLLLVMAAAVYGIAGGPRSRFVDAPVNPSVWGVFSLLVPGISRMRAIGRLALVGQGLLMAAAFPGALRQAARGRIASWAVLAALLSAAALQFADIRTLRAYSRNYPPDWVTPTAEEHDFLRNVDGSVLLLPSRPFHRNTHAMLYFSRFTDIRLMNGYSSRSTRLWDRIMEAGAADGEGCPRQIEIAREAGADWLVVFKYGIHRQRVDDLRSRESRPVFESDRLMVFSW